MKKRRLEKGLSLKDVANKAGVPASTYREWEGGRQIVGEPYLQLSVALEMSLFELVTGGTSQQFEVLSKIREIEVACQEIKQTLASMDESILERNL